jgi:hypothetical protein
MKVTTFIGATTSYANIDGQAEGFTLSVLLSPHLSVPASLRQSANELREHARKELLRAARMERAALILETGGRAESKSSLSPDVLLGASRESIASILIQDLVGEYDTPDQVAEWGWIESNASYAHKENGQAGIWEFVLNLGKDLTDIPARLQATIQTARDLNYAYLVFHQGT